MPDEPALRLQIIGHVTENQDAIKQMGQMMKNPNDSQKMKSMDHSSMKMNNKKPVPQLSII